MIGKLSELGRAGALRRSCATWMIKRARATALVRDMDD